MIRHAKSSWEVPVSDEKRPLSQRGVNDAHLVAEHISDILPNRFMVWSSPAKRAWHTSVIFSQVLNIPEELVVIKEDLYTFDVKKLFQIIKNCKNEYPNLILFGHNNAITDFVNKFGNKSIDNVPTSGVVVIEFDTEDWNDIDKGSIVKTIFPKELR